MRLNTETLQDLRGPPLGPASGMHFCLPAKPKNAGTLTLCALKTRLGEGKRAGELPSGKSHQPEQDFNSYTFPDLFRSRIFNVARPNVIKRKN